MAALAFRALVMFLFAEPYATIFAVQTRTACFLRFTASRCLLFRSALPLQLRGRPLGVCGPSDGRLKARTSSRD